MTNVPGLLVTVEDAARMLSLGRSSVYALVAKGRIQSILIGRSRRIPVTALQSFIAAELADEMGSGGIEG